MKTLHFQTFAIDDVMLKVAQGHRKGHYSTDPHITAY